MTTNTKASTEVRTATRAVALPVDPAARPLWRNSPSLGSTPGKPYRGRIIVEVFGTRCIVTVIGGDRGLLSQLAGDIPLGKFALHPASGPPYPISRSSHGGERFLGRVVAEIWGDRTNLGVFSQVVSTDSIIERAGEALQRYLTARK